MRIVNKKSFTLMEIIVVVIIIGVLASLTIPRFQIVIERTQSAEGVQILDVLYAAQRRNFMETGNYRLGSGAFFGELQDGDLDVDIPPPRYFNRVMVFPAPMYAHIVLVERTSPLGFYFLGITENGDVQCSSAPASLCNKLGYFSTF